MTTASLEPWDQAETRTHNILNDIIQMAQSAPYIGYYKSRSPVPPFSLSFLYHFRISFERILNTLLSYS